ncbi:MAG: TetR/AcrR family transcriptional regulator [Clostridia bacterium]|nr:TetR/AcrR family transcriptional regulator [Clostridia bacterium]
MRKGEQRKQELLRIAYRMFLSNGYESTSVDAIIDQAGIAKGTYYYYFASKEQMLEEVIGMMIEEEAARARQVLAAPLGVPQKIAGVIASLRPSREEAPIEDALNKPENVLMHKKIRQQLLETIVPLLSEAVEEGIREGIFDCDHIPERVKMLLVISSECFDDGRFTANDIDVYVDMAEKLLGAAPGAMAFIRQLIR